MSDTIRVELTRVFDRIGGLPNSGESLEDFAERVECGDALRIAYAIAHLLAAPDPQAVCTCGHTAHWHNALVDGHPVVQIGGQIIDVENGSGECEGGKDCSCKRFVRASGPEKGAT